MTEREDMRLLLLLGLDLPSPDTLLISLHPTASDVDVCGKKSSYHVTQVRIGGVCKSCSRVFVVHLKEKCTGLEPMGTVRYLWSLRLDLACTSKGTLKDEN